MRNLSIIILLLLMSCSSTTRVFKPSSVLTYERRQEMILELMQKSQFNKLDKKLWNGEYPHDIYVAMFMYLIMDSILVPK